MGQTQPVQDATTFLGNLTAFLKDLRLSASRKGQWYGDLSSVPFPLPKLPYGVCHFFQTWKSSCFESKYLEVDTWKVYLGSSMADINAEQLQA